MWVESAGKKVSFCLIILARVAADPLSANNKKAGSSPALLRGAPGALLRGTLADKLVDLIGRALLHPGQHVLINVQRDGTVCVAKAPGHDPDIDPHADQQ